MSNQLRALAVQHEDDAPPGLLADWAQRRGVLLDVIRPDRGERLPQPSATVDFVVVLGAAASVMDRTVAWLEEELRWIARVDALGVPMLGVCFGAQALAGVLGGAVRRAPRPELGWIEIEACAPDAGALAPGPWFSWHEDTFDTPPSARVLARNDAGVQAYRLGPHLGVQFHPEVTPAIVDRWIEQAGRDLPDSRVDPGSLQHETARRAPDAAARAHALFDDFATPG